MPERLPMSLILRGQATPRGHLVGRRHSVSDHGREEWDLSIPPHVSSVTAPVDTRLPMAATVSSKTIPKRMMIQNPFNIEPYPSEKMNLSRYLGTPTKES